VTHYIGPVVADCFGVLKDAGDGRRCLHTQDLLEQIICARIRTPWIVSADYAD
jgi:hypothetical protein